MAISNLNIVGRPFARWPATLQLVLGGVLDAALGGSSWASRCRMAAGLVAASEARFTSRGRQILAAAG